MADSDQAWDRAVQQFRALGRQLRERYRAEEGGDETAAEDRAAVERALRTISDAVERSVEAVGSAVRTPEFRDQAKQAARSLGDALGATFTDLGEGLRQRADGERTASPPDEGAGDDGDAR